MSNNKLDGFNGQTDIANAIGDLWLAYQDLLAESKRKVFELSRIADALERANEIEIGLHPLSVEEFNAVQKENDNDN